MRRQTITLLQFAPLLITLTIANTASTCNAQTKSFTMERELGRRFPAQLTPTCVFSPDGQWAAIVTIDLGSAVISSHARTASGILDNLEGSRIDLVNTLSGERIEISGSGASYTPVWSPNGDRLAFLSTRDGTLAVWLWEASSKASRNIQGTHVNGLNYFTPVWGPDGNSLLVQLTGPQTSRLGHPRGEEGGAKPIVRESLPVRSEDAEAAELRRGSSVAASDVLALINVVTANATEVAHVTPRLGWREVSPNGRWVGYLEFSGPGDKARNNLYDLHVYDLIREKDRIIASNVVTFYGAGAAWAPDSAAIAYLTEGLEDEATSPNPSGLYVSSRKPISDLWVAYLDGKAPLLLRRQLQSKSDGTGRVSLAAPMWTPDAKALLVLSNGNVSLVSTDRTQKDRSFSVPERKIVALLGKNRGRDFVALPHQPDTVLVAEMNERNENAGYAKLNLQTGATNVLWEEATPASRLAYNMYYSDVSRDGGQLVYVRERADLPPEFWLADTNFAQQRKLIEFNAELAGVRFGKSQVIDYLSSDGDKLRAALLLPPGYQPGTRVPLVVWVYPHPEHEANEFGLDGIGSMNMQLLASRGYAVLKPDTLTHTGWPVESLARCVLPAILKLIELGIADPTAVGIMGHSSGGMATVALLTRSTIFKAAIAESGYYDLFSTYGSGGAVVLSGYNAILTTPWKNQRVYLDNTPILNIDRVQTPLLIIVGEKDSMSALQSDELFTDLESLGKEAVLVKYPDEGHVPYAWSRANQVDLAKRMIDWFDEHLKKPRDQAAEKPKPN